MTKPATWASRPIVHEKHADDLDLAASVFEFRHGLPRHVAEQKAYTDYRKRQAEEAMAHHLRSIKIGQATGDKALAERAKFFFDVHARAAGHNPAAEPPPSVAKLAADPEQSHVKFKGHPADSLPLTKSEEASEVSPKVAGQRADIVRDLLARFRAKSDKTPGDRSQIRHWTGEEQELRDRATKAETPIQAGAAALLKASHNAKMWRKFNQGDPNKGPLKGSTIDRRTIRYLTGLGLRPFQDSFDEESAKEAGESTVAPTPRLNQLQVGFTGSDNWAGAEGDLLTAEHEGAHAMMTPAGKKMRSYFKWLHEGATGRIGPQQDHESTAMALGRKIQRRSGVKPGAEGNHWPGNDYEPHERQKRMRERSESHGGRATEIIARWDAGRKFNDRGVPHDPSGPDAAINRRQRRVEAGKPAIGPREEVSSQIPGWAISFRRSQGLPLPTPQFRSGKATLRNQARLRETHGVPAPAPILEPEK